MVTMKVTMYFVLFFSEEELATPPLDGIILPGVTRQSVLDLTRKWVSKMTHQNTYT